MIPAMRRVNLHTADLNRDDEPAGYEHAYLKLAPLIGGATMNGSYYELPPGQANCPYHYESDEEWLLVLEGRITVRHPNGEDELEAGDLVCFPGGPDGAHKLTNSGDGTARMLIVSTNNLPAVAVYPDSDKIGVWTGGPPGQHHGPPRVGRRLLRPRGLAEPPGAAQRADGGAATGLQPARRPARLGGTIAPPLGQRHAGRHIALDVDDLVHRAHVFPSSDGTGRDLRGIRAYFGCECLTSDLPNT